MSPVRRKENLRIAANMSREYTLDNNRCLCDGLTKAMSGLFFYNLAERSILSYSPIM